MVLSNRHVRAYVEDQDRNILVKASTEEFDIRKHLYKANDVSAAMNIGRVIADRCMRAGLNRVSMYTTDIRNKEKVICNVCSGERQNVLTTWPPINEIHFNLFSIKSLEKQQLQQA